MGALTFTPEHSPRDLPTSLEMSELVEAARRAVQGDLASPGTRTEAFRRMVFNVLASHDDNHTKSLSFLMERDGTWRLAPAYDVTFAYSPTSRRLSRHLMSVEGKVEHITTRDLEVLGDSVGVAGYSDIIASVDDAVARFETFADAAGVSPARKAEITEPLGLVRAEVG